MIDLPPGFDAVLFASEIYQFVTPFVTISALFLAYKLIKKVTNRI